MQFINKSTCLEGFRFPHTQFGYHLVLWKQFSWKPSPHVPVGNYFSIIWSSAIQRSCLKLISQVLILFLKQLSSSICHPYFFGSKIVYFVSDSEVPSCESHILWKLYICARKFHEAREATLVYIYSWIQKSCCHMVTLLSAQHTDNFKLYRIVPDRWETICTELIVL